MLNKNELISYAMEFSSYLILKIPEINQVILHGSVARGDFTKDSDIDIFIDSNKKTEKKARIAEEDYYKTESFKRWKLKGIKNEISLIIGELNSKEWKNLKRAIINTGIILFGKYTSEVEKTHQYTIFVFENIKPESKRISIHRKLFGFKIRKKQYSGLVRELGGKKLGKSVIIIPAQHTEKLRTYFKDKKVKIQIYDFWSDNEV